MGKENNKVFISGDIPPVSGTKSFSIPLSTDNILAEGIEGEALSVIPATELKERAEFEENTGMNFDTHLPNKVRRDEICETFGPVRTTYIDPEQLIEEGAVSVVGSSGIGRFYTSDRGFDVGYKTGFHSIQGRGFSTGIGVGFDYTPSKGFDIKFSNEIDGFYPDGFDTSIRENILSNPVLCQFVNLIQA
jgi:hypothetical protein